jgi:hypothetical protein
MARDTRVLQARHSLFDENVAMANATSVDLNADLCAARVRDGTLD